MKAPSLKDNFATHIRERGLDYHRRKRIRDLLLDKDIVTATVLGNRNYRVKINLKNNSMKCTCPCDFNCKHEAAVLYTLRSNKNVEKMDDILKELNKKTKKSLIELIHKMISTEPKFKSIVSDNPKNILKQIKQLDLENYGGIDSLIEEVDMIHESITEKGNDLNLLISLFKKCFSIWEAFGSDITPLEDSMFEIQESMSKSTVKMTKSKKKKALKEVYELIEDYDFFLDGFEE